MRPVPSGLGKEYADIIAELAFEIFSVRHQTRDEDQASKINVEQFEVAKKRVAKRLIRFKLGRTNDWLQAQKRVPSEVASLVSVYSYFFEKLYVGTPLTFRPKIKGAGILKTLEADVSSVESLIEIKTVKRNLTSHDFRQLLTYLALGLASGEYTWHEAVFFNPRRAVFYTFNVAALVSYLSARSAPDAFDEFIYFLSEREIDLSSF